MTLRKLPVRLVLCCLTVLNAPVHADDKHAQDDEFYAAAAALLPPAVVPLAAPVEPAESNLLGGWNAPITMPHVPVTAANLPDGRVLTFASNQRTSFPVGPEFTYAAVWNPDTGSITELNWNQHDMFCGGTVMRADGKFQVMGGRNTVRRVSTFDWTTNSWARIADMVDPRWYTGSLILPDNNVFTLSGDGGPYSAERFNGSTWTKYAGINWSPAGNGTIEANWTPLVFLAPDGRVFHAGPHKTMNYLNVTGSGSFTPSGAVVPGTWYPKDASVVMYEPGKILMAGGMVSGTSESPTNLACTINLYTDPPTVTSIPSMAFTRRFSNGIVLPSGEVLVIGGNTSGQKFSDVGAVMAGEIWNPRTNSWRTVASMSVPRNYHSVALMLADGRVMAGGSGLANNAPVDHSNIEIFNPPNLYSAAGTLAARPTLTQAPTILGTLGRFTVRGTADLRRFAMIRMASVSHSLTTDQRYFSPAFCELSSGVYELSPHNNANVMVPGYWMLYGIDANGVPSKAKIIQVSESVNVPIPGTNLALGRPTTQSSTLAATYSASRAVDGNKSASYVTAPGSHTQLEANPWWEVDLGAVFPLNAVKIFNRAENTGSRLADFTVQVSNFAITPSNTDVSNYRYRFTPGPETVINLYRSARFVRIQLNTTNYLQLAEVEVLGGTVPISGVTMNNPGNLLSPRQAPVNVQLVAAAASQVTWTATGLPAGLTLNSATGLISGIPTTVGQTTVSITATLADNSQDVESFLWTIHPPGEAPGLVYRYYEGAWSVLPDFATLTPVRSGVVDSISLTPREREDNYALMFQGMLRIPTAGTWTFYTNSDEGSQVWIDGRLIANNDGVHTALEASGSISLPAGDHQITVTYFQATGAQSLAVSYAGPGVTKQLIPASSVYQPEPGVSYDYYEGNWTALPNFAALTPVKSGTITNFSLAPRNRDENFGMRFRATLRTPIAGSYTFYTSSDDGSKVWIDGIQIVNNDGLHAATEQSGTLSLTAGTHAIEVAFFEATGGESLIVSYSGPGLARQVIPDSVLAKPGVPGAAPVVTALAARTTVTGTAVNQQVVATDVNGDTLSYSATGLPPGLAIGPATGIISGAPTTAGAYSVVITVNDGTGRSGSTSFVWTVVDPLTLSPLTATAKPAGTAINYSLISTGGNNPKFKWNFGDGTGDTTPSATRTISKTFSQPGRYQVTVMATDDSGASLAVVFVQAVYGALTAKPPTSSRPVAYEVRATGGDRVWNVNPDSNTVSAFITTTNAKSAEIAVGTQPVSIATSPDGRLWVVNKKSASLSIINPATSTVAATISLPRASQPHGLAFSPDGSAAWVALEATGQLLKLNVTTGATLGAVDVGLNPRHLSVTADSSKVLVSRFITPMITGENTAVVQTTVGGINQGGEVVVISTASLTKTKTIILQHSERPDAENAGRGIPNYLGPPVISPDGSAAWVPSKQDNVKRGVLRDTRQLTHDSTVRAIASRIIISTEAEDYASRLDFDDSAVPSNAVFDSTGVYLFVALEGSRQVAVVDAFARQVLFKISAGRAPQGLTLSPDNTKLYVHNFMDRTVTVHDLTSLINGGRPAGSDIPTIATWNTVAADGLSATVLKGKQFFYDALDSRISLQSYISCAACHNDGGHDGRTWDFTGMGEGLRNTTDLRGKSGVGQGPAHWTGNFDEIQDFEKQIRDLGRGTGLMTDAQFNTGTRSQSLGDPKAGVSPDLDALAAYVTSLTAAVPSPQRAGDGTLTTAAVAGKDVFRIANCASCHSGSGFTDSAVNVLHNVGTIKPSSGQRLGAALTGFDTPTLRSIWNTAPYLHDGSAATLTAAVQAHQGIALGATDLANLVAYLGQVDDAETTAPAPAAPTITLGAPASATLPFAVTISASVAVTGLTTSDFTISNGTATSLTGSGTSWTLNVTPTAAGVVTVSLPANTCVSISSIGNVASNTTSTAYQPNRAPLVTNPGAQATVRGTPVSLSIIGSDPDGQALSWSATGLPTGLSIGLATGVISGTVSALATASNSVTVTATDGLLSAAATFAWTTTAPAIVNGLRGEYFSGMTPGLAAPLLTRIDPTLNFDWGSGSPAAAVPADQFSVRWTGFLTAPFTETYTFALPVDNGVRVWINNVLVLDKWTPADITGWHGFDVPLVANQAVPFKVEYAEQYGGANIALFWFSARQPWEIISTLCYTPDAAANRAPVVTTPIAQSSVRGRSASLQMLASDPDFNALTYTATGLPAGLSIQSATGLISGIISASAVASNNVVVTVSDGTLSAQASFSWTTAAPPPNSAPIVTNPGTQNSIRGTIITMTPQAVDPDSDAITWSATGLPLGLSMAPATGQISGTISNSAAAAYTVVITAKDVGNLASSATFTWNTTAPPLNGLRGEYFAGMTPGLTTPLMTRTDATLDFDWGGGSPGAPVSSDEFSIRWTGTLTALYTETYNFALPVDNGVRVWINNVLVLDKWTPADTSGWHNFTAALTANVAVPIKIEYFEQYGGAGISLFWFSNRQSWEIISTARFSPAVVLPPNSAETAVHMVKSTQQIFHAGDGSTWFSFSRPSSSAGIVSVMIEESSNLKKWTINDTPSIVKQFSDGTEDIMVQVPVPEAGSTSPAAKFYRVHFIVPDVKNEP